MHAWLLSCLVAAAPWAYAPTSSAAMRRVAQTQPETSTDVDSEDPAPAPITAGDHALSPPAAEVVAPAVQPSTPTFAALHWAPMLAKWDARLYGFVEADAMWDSTQSFMDLAGNAAIAPHGTYAGDHSRLTFSVRNSRVGLKLAAPGETWRASAILEMDFLGNQPTTVTEAATFVSPTFRMRHFALKLECPCLEVLVGQYWNLFGWQSYVHPNTVEIQGVPGQLYSRNPQLRLTHVFRSAAVNLELAAAAVRPAQRDAGVPDGQAGVRLVVNDHKGIRTSGNVTAADPLHIGVSGVVRRLAPPGLATPSREVVKTGWGVAVDAMLPVVSRSMDDKVNGLIVLASLARGEGIADMYSGLTGGLGATATRIDPGLVAFRTDGSLHVIGWQSVLVGLQYYLPPTGDVWLSLNYSRINSPNAASLGPQGTVFSDAQWADLNVFWNLTEAVRFGVEYAWFEQKYNNGVTAQNHRGQFTGLYIF